MGRRVVLVVAAVWAGSCGSSSVERPDPVEPRLEPPPSVVSVVALPPHQPEARGLVAQPAAEAPDAGHQPPPAPPAPDPGKKGPYLAGVRTVQLTDPARSRTFSVDVWYPVDPAQPDGKSNQYALTWALGTLASMSSPARRDATPAALGPRPLVLFSHGYGGVRFQSYFLTEHLASWGYVVAAPDHPGNLLTDFGQLGSDAARDQSAIDRPLDVLYTLDRMLAGSSGVPVTVDAARVAITGHSFGGWTALEAARRDPRLKVAFPMAPGFRNGSTPAFVASLARPLFFLGGSEDQTCPFDTDQLAPYQLAAPPRALLEVEGAGHLDFSNLCEVPVALLFVNDGCDAQKIPPQTVHARVNAVATAFLGRHLLGDPGYEAWLSPPSVQGRGNVTFWRDP